MRSFSCDLEEFAAEQFMKMRLADDLPESSLSQYVLLRSLSPASNWQQAVEVTGGSSGSFFFKTADGSLILKTITEDEKKVFLGRVLPQWDSQDDTSVMCRVYGLFSVRVPGTTKEYVLVMNNLTQRLDPVSAVFDLKGSSFTRRVVKGGEEEMPRGETLKDSDFRRMVGKLAVSEEDKNRLGAALLTDVSLLTSLNLMDYSLLVGIGEFHGSLKSLPVRFQRNLFPCTNAPNRVYAIGLIDFLQDYSLVKMLEGMGKRLLASQLQISSVSPQLYSERFLDMMAAITD